MKDELPTRRDTADAMTAPPLRAAEEPSDATASSASSASMLAALGTRSLGLSRNVFPAVTASGHIHRPTIAGKLNGHTPAATPSGWRRE